MAFKCDIVSSKRRCDIPRKSPYVISLSSREKGVLQQLTRKYTLSYFKVIRAKAILLAADGLENRQIGEKLDLPREIVSKWRKRFFEERLSGLQDRPRRGGRAVFPPKVVMEVKALACQLPYETRAGPKHHESGSPHTGAESHQRTAGMDWKAPSA